MLVYNNINEARDSIRHMSIRKTEALGDAEVWKYDDGGIVIVEDGETLDGDKMSEEIEPAELIGTVKELFY